MGWIIAAVVGAILLGFELWLRIAFGYAARSVYSGVPELRPRTVDQPTEAIRETVRTADGVDLAGYLWPPQAQQPIVVFGPESGASGETAAFYAAPLLEAGYGVFAIDFRGTGRSGNREGYVPHHWVTDHEVADMRAAFDAAIAHASTASDGQASAASPTVGLLGVSKGAAAGLLAAREYPEVVAAVAVSAFDTHDVARTFGLKWAFRVLPRWVDAILPRWHIAQTIRLGGAWEAWARSVSYPSLRRSLRATRGRQLLFVSGLRDSYVPPPLAERLVDAAARGNAVDAWFVPKAKHNRARDTEPDDYDRRLTTFFDAALDGRNRSERTTASTAMQSDRSSDESVASVTSG